MACTVVYYALIELDDVSRKGQTFFGLFTSFAILLVALSMKMGHYFAVHQRKQTNNPEENRSQQNVIGFSRATRSRGVTFGSGSIQYLSFRTSSRSPDTTTLVREPPQQNTNILSKIDSILYLNTIVYMNTFLRAVSSLAVSLTTVLSVTVLIINIGFSRIEE